VSEQRTICREHHWPEDTYNPERRCVVCGIHERLYYQFYDAIRKWTKKEQKAEPENYARIIETSKCKLHIHTPTGYELVSNP
jgi:hypothetical protein